MRGAEIARLRRANAADCAQSGEFATRFEGSKAAQLFGSGIQSSRRSCGGDHRRREHDEAFHVWWVTPRNEDGSCRATNGCSSGIRGWYPTFACHVNCSSRRVTRSPMSGCNRCSPVDERTWFAVRWSHLITQLNSCEWARICSHRFVPRARPYGANLMCAYAMSPIRSPMLKCSVWD